METIDQLIHETCLRAADSCALREKVGDSWVETSYRQLDEQVNAIAAGLLACGFTPRQHAAILAPSSPRWMACYLGILRSGGVVVPVDKELKGAEIRHILADCGARILFTDQAHFESLQEMLKELENLDLVILIDSPAELAREAPLEDSLHRLSGAVDELARKYDISADELESLRQPVERLAEQLLRQRIQPQAQSELPWHLSLLERFARREQEPRPALSSLERFCLRAEIPPAAHGPQDTAMILYTSGTTGKAKGAMLSHGGVLANIRAAVDIFQLDGGIRTLSFLPINHVYELVCGNLVPLSLGGSISYAESLKKLALNLAEVQPSFLLGVPAVFQRLLERIIKGIEEKPLARALFHFPLTKPLIARKVRRKLGQGTIFISGGAALDPSVAQGLLQLGIEVYQGYGITETSPIVAAERPGQTKLGSVGLPLPGVEVQVVDANEEGVGEFWVRGPNVMQGYYNNPRATAEVITDGWYHTGDLGRIDEHGFLTIHGRVKNLIVTPNGKNVYPEEVEQQLLKSPLIAEAMVYGHKSDGGGEEVHAIIVADQEALDNQVRRLGKHPLDQQEVIALIRREVIQVCRQLADFKRIKKFTLREEELPKTTTRKVKRFAVEADIPAQAISSKENATNKKGA